MNNDRSKAKADLQDKILERAKDRAVELFRANMAAVLEENPGATKDEVDAAIVADLYFLICLQNEVLQESLGTLAGKLNNPASVVTPVPRRR